MRGSFISKRTTSNDCARHAARNGEMPFSCVSRNKRVEMRIRTKLTTMLALRQCRNTHRRHRNINIWNLHKLHNQVHIVLLTGFKERSRSSLSLRTARTADKHWSSTTRLAEINCSGADSTKRDENRVCVHMLLSQLPTTTSSFSTPTGSHSHTYISCVDVNFVMGGQVLHD